VSGTPRRRGRYELGGLLGSGGMGNVHVARQVGPLGVTKRVAIKELHPHLARDAEFVAMLLEEARIQAALEHPNVVPVLDVVARDGELLVVLALVAGPSLAEILRPLREHHARVPASVAVGLVLDVLEGLHAAHELRGKDGVRLGVVHRDVSPHNILVADGVARITDFGVAKVLDRAQLTRGGQLKGKPGYMSPEQLDGRPVDARSDVFSAALLLAEMLTGARVCPSNDAAEVRRFFLSDLAMPAVWLAGRDVEPALAAWLARCLDVDPGARPTSARAAALALAEAHGRASAGEVAAWVERVAGELVAAKREAVEISGGEDTATAPTGTAGTREASWVHAHGAPSTPAPGSREGTAALFRAPPTALLVTLAAVAGAFVCGRSTREEQAVAQPVRRPSATVVATPLPPEAAPVARVGSPVPRGLASTPSPSVTALVAPAMQRAPEPAPPFATRRAHPAREAPPAARSAATPSCTPPYDVDATGVRVFKPECL
jgi:serine/threonine-protein kinase